jgi:hypothetical protein
VSGVLIQCNWRSCGSWISRAIRQGNRHLVFFEPCYEQLGDTPVAVLRSRFARAAGRFRHTGAPSSPFDDFPQDRYGFVDGYHSTFAFSDRGTWLESEVLEFFAYLRGLAGTAHARKLQLAIKPCRWMTMTRELAEELNLAVVGVVRHPDAMFRSYWSFGGNRSYFLVASLLWLAHRRVSPALVRAKYAIGVEMPSSSDVSEDLLWALRLCQRLDAQALRDLVLVLWTATVAHNIAAGALLVDVDRLADETYRDATEKRISGLIDSDVRLSGFSMGAQPAAPGETLSTRGVELSNAVAVEVLGTDRLPNRLGGKTGALWQRIVECQGDL